MRAGSTFVPLLRRWPLIVLCTALACAGAVAFLLTATPKYTARASVFFAVDGASSGADLAQGGAYTAKQIASYAQIAESPYVLTPVIAQRGLSTTPSELASRMSATAPDQSSVLQIVYTSTDPGEAAATLNAVANRLVTTVGDLSPSPSRRQAQIRATLIAPAETPTSPSSPNRVATIVGALTLGLVLGGVLAFLRVMTDTRVRNEQDVREAGTAPVVAHVPDDRSTKDQPVAAWHNPHGARAEAYRRLRTNLRFLLNTDRARSIVVTSSTPGEGKSTTAINLAATAAEAGWSVLVVDCDLRRPRLSDYLGIDGSAGLTNALIDPETIGDLVQSVSDNLDVLTAGPIPPNPSELLGSERMASLLATLSDRYDLLVLDSPPLLPVTDAAVLSAACGGTLVVASAGTTRKPHLRAALEHLDTVDGHTMGVVLNKLRLPKRDPYRYEYRESAPAPQATT